MDKVRKAVRRGNELLGELIEDHVGSIVEAYKKDVEGGSYTVNLSLRFKPDENDIEVKAGIGFIEGRVKDEAIAKVSDQMDLPNT